MEKVLVCQSCGMPIEKDEIIGTNADGSKNNDYCVYCFKNNERRNERILQKSFTNFKTVETKQRIVIYAK